VESLLTYLAQILLNGAHNGGLYALLAYGYVLTYQVTKRASFAHGALFAFSGQNLILFTAFGWNSLWLLFPLALAFGMAASAALSALVLAILARTVYPPFISRSPNTMIAATLGVAIALMELARLGADTRDFWLPRILAAPVRFGGENAPSLTQVQLVDLAIIAFALLASSLILRRSRAGRYLRAVADDPEAAELLGVSRKRVTEAAIICGGGYAVLAGFLAAVYFGNIGFGAGLVFALKILFVASAGGFTAPLHAAAGALLFGMAESLWDGYFPVIYRDAALYAVLTLLLIMRPENAPSIEAR
jgi:branched-chain amino acid transport system permease protein